MKREFTTKSFVHLNYSELLEKKKKVASHLVNLECKKQQLLVLIDKLSNLSRERKDLIPGEQSQSIFSKLFSMGDQLKQADNNKNKLDAEIIQAKEQIELLNCVLSEKKLSDRD